MSILKIGFIGLGSMGLPIASNIAKGGFAVFGYDLAASELWARAPIQATSSIASLLQKADVICLSLPDAGAVRDALAVIVVAEEPKPRAIIDFSTIGVVAAKEFEATLASAGMNYVDAPVSGGVAGARDRKISVMCACPETVFSEIKPILDAISGKVFHVGEAPGQGQAVKILNNFLSASALIATSEAALFGIAHGVELGLLCDIVKASSGRNSAIDDKFPNHIVRGQYDSGFRNTLMAKDLDLYLSEVESAGTPQEASRLVVDAWRRFADEMPNEDFTRVFEYIRSRSATV